MSVPRYAPEYSVKRRVPRMWKALLGETKTIPFYIVSGQGATLDLEDASAVFVKPDGTSGSIAPVPPAQEKNVYYVTVDYDQPGIWEIILSYDVADNITEALLMRQYVRVIE